MTLDFSSKHKPSFSTKGSESWQIEIHSFLEEWYNDEPTIIVKTSGSTGKPKEILLTKQAMINSALATGSFLNLKKGQTALLCLPVSYIAGKMMLVRAIVLGLKIICVEPKSVFKKKDIEESTIDFGAMTPMQAEQSQNFLPNIKKLILGGAPVSSKLKKSLQNL